MINITNVLGSQEQVIALEINVDTVYERSNIVPITTETFTGWQYGEKQYSKDEYIKKIANDNENIQKALNDVILSGFGGVI